MGPKFQNEFVDICNRVENIKKNLSILLDIEKAATYNNDIYLLFKDNEIRRFELASIAKLISKLYQCQRYILSAMITVAFQSTIAQISCRRYVPLSILADLKQQIEGENHNELATRIANILDTVEVSGDGEMVCIEDRKSTTTFDKLETGIYVLRQRTESEAGDSDINTSLVINNQDNTLPNEDEKNNTTSDTGLKLGINAEEDTRKNNLSRQQSSESLVSLNSTSSNELVFGPASVGM